MLQKISDFIKSESQSMLKNRQQSQQFSGGGGGGVGRIYSIQGEVVKREGGGKGIFSKFKGGWLKGGVKKFRGVWTLDEAMP